MVDKHMHQLCPLFSDIHRDGAGWSGAGGGWRGGGGTEMTLGNVKNKTNRN